MKRYEVAAGLGPSFFFGDIGGFSKVKKYSWIKRSELFSDKVQLKFKFKIQDYSRNINARLSLTYGFLHATDGRGSNEDRGL